MANIKIAPRISLPHNFDGKDFTDVTRSISEFVRKVEDYLNAEVAIFLVYDKNQVLPTFRPGDIVFDFSANQPFATLQQWNGQKLIPL